MKLSQISLPLTNQLTIMHFSPYCSEMVEYHIDWSKLSASAKGWHGVLEHCLHFHSFTGCDTVSFFAGRGKKTAWDMWISNDEITTIFQQLTNFPNEILDDQLALLERFVVLLHDHTSIVTQKNFFEIKKVACSCSVLSSTKPTMAVTPGDTTLLACCLAHNQL